MKNTPLFSVKVALAFFLCLISVKAQNDSSKNSNSSDALPMIVTTQRITKSICIDLKIAPAKNNQTIIADPITLLLSSDTLNLTVHSSTYYTSNFFSESNDLGCDFNPSNWDSINKSILAYEFPKTNDDREIKVWHPQGIGSVVIEFEADLVIKEGSWVPYASSQKRHVTVQVPVNVME
ncbi:MAG: hypothetical protein K2W97_02625 [Chthoniobacterales bacterium]|nr:hypothetical protein [Chthoniobacterales bacterium]